MSKRFKTQDYAKFKKLGIRWRKPSGRQSKLRVKKTGSGMLVKVGYRTAKSIRGKIQGMDAPVISNISGLAGKKAVIISSSVGLKKAQAILEKAADLGVKVLNGRRVKDGLKSRERKAAMPKAVEEKKQVTEKISETKIEKEAQKGEPPKADSKADIKEEKATETAKTSD